MSFENFEIEYIVKPIFDALIKNNASLELIKNVFLDIKNPDFFEFLPNSLKNDPSFIQECLKNNLINIENISKELKNQEFISREMYLSNVEKDYLTIKNEIYPQDEEIILKAIKGNHIAYLYVHDEFKKDKELMFKCIQINPEVTGFVESEIKEEFLNNEKLVKETLKIKPEFFYQIEEEKKHTSPILKAVLETDKGYKLVKEYLKRSKDPEIALMALKIDDGARKHIHQIYGSILKKHKVKENYYNFLKIYLSQKELEKELPKNETEKVIKSKI